MSGTNGTATFIRAERRISWVEMTVNRIPFTRGAVAATNFIAGYLQANAGKTVRIVAMGGDLHIIPEKGGALKVPSSRPYALAMGGTGVDHIAFGPEPPMPETVRLILNILISRRPEVARDRLRGLGIEVVIKDRWDPPASV